MKRSRVRLINDVVNSLFVSEMVERLCRNWVVELVRIASAGGITISQFREVNPVEVS